MTITWDQIPAILGLAVGIGGIAAGYLEMRARVKVLENRMDFVLDWLKDELKRTRVDK